MNFISRWKIKQIKKFLKDTPSEKLSKLGDSRLIRAFREAAGTVPAYKRFLDGRAIDIDAVRDVESFKRLVPIINKDIFSCNELHDMCRGGCLDELKRVTVSSGFSGAFAYGLTCRSELALARDFVDAILDHNFRIGERKTFLINTLGMGVRVETSLASADVSVRPDMVFALLKKLAGHFDQFIVVGNTYFIKHMLEEGIEQGIDWKSMTMHIIIGEDWFPENYRDYLATLLGINPDSFDFDKGSIVSSMGICELAVTLFQECRQTIRLRRLAEKDPVLRREIFGEGVNICPILFQYHPSQIFLEDDSGELVFTTLGRDVIIPLIRYASKDKGRIYPYNEMKNILNRLKRGDCLPEWKLPMVWVMGRCGKSIEIGDVSITPEQVKAGLYSGFEAASATTGYFRMSKQDDCVRIEIQLRRGRGATDELKKKFSEAVNRYVKTDFELMLYPYENFPYGMGLIYEQKFKYID